MLWAGYAASTLQDSEGAELLLVKQGGKEQPDHQAAATSCTAECSLNSQIVLKLPKIIVIKQKSQKSQNAHTLTRTQKRMLRTKSCYH